MKKFLFAFFGMASFFTLHAQILYTTTSNGGNSGGTLSRLETSTGNLTAAFTFDAQDGEYPAWHSRLVLADDGKFYGMTYTGGSNGVGTIFSYNPSTATYSTLYDFDNQNGANPFSSLIQAKNGKLYGMTNYGGNYGSGVIFSFDPGNLSYTKLFDFNSANGAYPQGSLMQAQDGKLYGMTLNGGTYDDGVIFSYSIKKGIFTKLEDFDGSNGAYPVGDFIQADGILYATTFNGGNNNWGTIISYNPVTAVLTKLKDFDSINGMNPKSSFIKGSDGNFYAMTWAGGNTNYGVIFSYNPVTNVYKKLKDFNYVDGIRPDGSLLQANGKLFGLTAEGGSYFRGVMFSYNISTGVYKKLKDFDGTDGSNPFGSLVKSANGKLYGCAYNGGDGDHGVLFSYNLSNRTFTKLKDFGTNNTGSLMDGGVVKDSSNTLYGMTRSGGEKALGVLFSFNPYTSVYTKLFDFDGSNGATPYGSLVLASNGKFYGMTFSGGANGSGVIFSYDLSTFTYTKLKDLNNADGAFPYGNLVQATNGKLYGITNGGGNSGSGALFSFDPLTSAYVKRVDFTGANGAYPTGSLMLAANGKLYGVTYNGGTTNGGVLFSYNPAAHVYKVLKDFNNFSEGMNPNGTLVQASNGKLYGMTTYGGTTNSGTIFSYNPFSGVYKKVKDFDYDNGGVPKGSLLKGSDGKLYGVTSQGGAFDDGVAFSFDPVKNIYTKIQDFNDSNGKAPTYTFFTELLNINNGFSKESIMRENYIAKPFIIATPNPAAKIIHVTLNGFKGNISLCLTDIQGKILKAENLKTDNTKTLHQQINIADLPGGAYFLTVRDGRNMQTVKIIKG